MLSAEAHGFRPVKVRHGFALSVLLFSAIAAVGWVVFLVQFHRYHVIGAGHLFPDDHSLTDFYLYKPTFTLYHTEAFNHEDPLHSRFAYPPLLAPIYRGFYALPHPTRSLMAATLLLWSFLIGWALRTLWGRLHENIQRAALLCSALLGFPAIFLFERGNMELFVWAATSLGLFFYCRGSRNVCGFLFGIATALKLYPIILLGLLLNRKSWRALLVGLASAVGLTVLAIWYSGPTFGQAARGFVAGIAGFQNRYAGVLRRSEIIYDHSLFSVVKVIAARCGQPFQPVSPFYFATGAVLFGGLYFMRVRRLAWQNRVLFLSVSMILLPQVSYTYTLVHLYVPGLLLADAFLQPGGQPTRAGYVAFVCLLFAMLPVDLFPYRTLLLAGQVQSLALLVLAIASSGPMFSPYADEQTAQPVPEAPKVPPLPPVPETLRTSYTTFWSACRKEHG